MIALAEIVRSEHVANHHLCFGGWRKINVAMIQTLRLCNIGRTKARSLIVVTFAAVNLSACSTIATIDCSLGTPRADCAKDTAGYQAALEERHAKELTATIDDARCSSFGAPGSPGYARCRVEADKQRPPAAR